MTIKSAGSSLAISEIVTEFGGSTPHALSEYYAGGTQVASGTGSIPTSGNALAMSVFYGTSNNISHSTTLTIGRHEIKVSQEIIGYHNSDSWNSGASAHGGTHANSLGSLADASVDDSITIRALYRESVLLTADKLYLEFSTGVLNWTKVTINGSDFTRSSADAESDNTRFYWTTGDSSDFTEYTGVGNAQDFNNPFDGISGNITISIS